MIVPVVAAAAVLVAACGRGPDNEGVVVGADTTITSGFLSASSELGGAATPVDAEPAVGDRGGLHYCEELPMLESVLEGELRADQSRAQNKAHDITAALGIRFDGSGFDRHRHRAVLYLLNPSRETFTELAERLPDLSAVCIDARFFPEPPPPGWLEAIPQAELADPLVECSNGVALPSSQFARLPSIDEVDHPVVDRLRPELEALSGDSTTDRRWVVIEIGTYRATFAALSSAGSTSVGFERRDHRSDRWRRAGDAWESPCAPMVPLPPGLARVEVHLDPESPPEPDSTSIDLLVTEQGCANGRAMGDALRGPQVVETDEAVLVAFAVAPIGGGATCPGNPSAAVAVELSAPLGERGLFDGLYNPPRRLAVESR